MEIILIILTSSIISGLMFFAYQLGKNSKQENDGLTVTKYNQQAIKDMNEWRNFTGGN